MNLEAEVLVQHLAWDVEDLNAKETWLVRLDRALERASDERRGVTTTVNDVRQIGQTKTWDRRSASKSGLTNLSKMLQHVLTDPCCSTILAEMPDLLRLLRSSQSSQ